LETDLTNDSSSLIRVFTKEAQEFRERANRYWATMEQLERTISTVDGGRNQPSPQGKYGNPTSRFLAPLTLFCSFPPRPQPMISEINQASFSAISTAIEDAILSQHSSFMSFASQIADLHSDVESIKRDYRNWYQAQFRSVVDPFAGIEST